MCASAVLCKQVAGTADNTKPSVILHGAEAITELKQQGSYDSLAAALEATRYQIRQTARPKLWNSGGTWQAVNAAQRLKADFTPHAISMAEYDTPDTQTSAASDWRFAMKLTGYGYGDQLAPVSEGTITANGARIELVRTALADSSAKITEWYVNDARGLEQGFTLAAPPRPLAWNAGGEKLRLQLALTGDLRARASSDGQSVALLDQRCVQVLNYGGLVVRDALGRELEARMTASDSEVVIETDDAGAVYPVVIDPVFTQLTKLTPSDGAAGDLFGFSVAVNGDTALVGAFRDDIDGKEDQGSATVFVRTGTTWTQQQKLIANDGAAYDYFGRQLAVSGDTALISASYDDINGKTDQGSAYAFVRIGTTWVQQQKLTDVDGEEFEYFGQSLALNGDLAVIGSYNDDIGGNANQGSALVFVRNGTTWTQQQKLLADDGAPNDRFGGSVAVSDNTILVGAYDDTINGNLAQGSVYVFGRNGTIWTQQQKLTASDGAEQQYFGLLLSLGVDTVLIAASQKVYVFVRNGTTWAQQQQLAPSDATPGSSFGDSIALDVNTALIGDHFKIVGGNQSQGAAYVFVRSGTTWTQQQKLTASDGAAGDFFGVSVALSANTALVGAHFADINSNQNAGAAYQFSISSIFPQQAVLVASDGAANDNFGRALALNGDTALIGNYGDDAGGIENRGSAYVFVRNGTTWTQQQELLASDGMAGDFFGGAVALEGDTALIGAYGDDINGNGDQGSAYVFVRSGTTWMQQQKLVASDGAGNDVFGFAVALSGETALVGAYGKLLGATPNAGAAYAFVRSGTTWTQQQKLTAADIAGDDYFGRSVALDGNTALVGAAGDDIGPSTNQGSAYVFVRNATTWTEQQKLTAGDSVANDNFGLSVALSGNTALIGAFLDDISGKADQGSAYVFVRSGTTWTEQQKLTASDGVASDNFGVGVALDGDTAVIGAWFDDINGNVDQGSAYVFIRNGIVWTQQQKLFASDGLGGDVFGYAVALSGGKALIGSFGDEVNATLDQGSAYLFGVNCPTININPATLPTGTAGISYSQALTGSGGSSPYSFAIITGSLPNGVTLSSGGLLSGTPTTFGSFNFTVRTMDNNGCQGTQAYTLTINPPCGTITVNPATLPNGTVGTAYNQTATASGGTAPYQFSLSAGTLPGGLTLATGGALTGLPNAPGTFNFTIKATDANGCMGTRAYMVTVTGGGGSTGLQFFPLLQPVRLLDTRPGASPNACSQPNAPITGQTSHTQPGRNLCTIPANAQALTGNVTTVQSGGGFLTLYPSDATQPTVASTNYGVNEIINNVFTVGLGADGAFKIFAQNTTDVVVDVTGYYAPPGVSGLYFHPLPAPVRLLETRPGLPVGCVKPGVPLTGNTDSTQQASSACTGIPAAARAIVGNATTVGPQGRGFLTLFPGDAMRPLVASSNYNFGQIVNGPFSVGLAANGEFKIYTTSTTDLVVDVLGYYSPEANDANGAGLLFTPLARPVRLLETRNNPAFPGCFKPNAPLNGQQVYTQPARGLCEGVTIPAAALAVVGNATVVFPVSGGYLTLWPSSAAQPTVATSNYNTNDVGNRHFIVGLGNGDGAFKMFSSATTELVLDLSGYFAP